MKRKLKIVVLLDAARAYDRDLLMGISCFNKRHDRFTLFLTSPRYIGEEHQRQLVKRIIAWKPDGILTRELECFMSLLQLNIPVILFPHTKLYSSFINVWADQRAIGATAAEHLISKGFKHFAFLGFKDFQWSQERQVGYEAALHKAGYTVTHYVYDHGALLWEHLPAMLSHWLAMLRKPCAIFSVTDELNMHLLEAAKSLEAKVPDDFSLIGVDNDVMLCEMASPTLSSIDHNARQAGFQAALALNRWIESGERPAGDIVMKPGVIITRNSTCVLAVEDEQVRTALHFIANTAPCEDISVEDVVKATTYSRRMLEKKFKTNIKRTIQEEIKKVRIERIKCLLTNSDLTVQQIACELNFRNFANITRYFKQHTGLTPLEYRGKHKGA